MHYEVRFHLSAGKHYKHWQIKHKEKNKIIDVTYYDPYKYQLILKDCELINKPKVAAQIFQSKVRDVCGWVKCFNFSVAENKFDLHKFKKLVYDPKIKTFWHFENENKNIDGEKFNELITIEKRVFCYAA